jgi:hypothetical protein
MRPAGINPALISFCDAAGGKIQLRLESHGRRRPQTTEGLRASSSFLCRKIKEDDLALKRQLPATDLRKVLAIKRFVASGHLTIRGDAAGVGPGVNAELRQGKGGLPDSSSMQKQLVEGRRNSKGFNREELSKKWGQKNGIGALRSKRGDGVYYFFDRIFLT